MQAVEQDRGAVAARVEQHAGSRVLSIDPETRFEDISAGINGLITRAWAEQAPTIAIPVECLPEAFFQPQSGLAVKISQKLVNYRITVAFVGPIAARLAQSEALAGFIQDCNRGRWIWFVEDIQVLANRLAPRSI